MKNEFTAMIGETRTEFLPTGDFYAHFAAVSASDNLTPEQWTLIGKEYKHSFAVKVNSILKAKNLTFENNSELLSFVKRNLHFILELN